MYIISTIPDRVRGYRGGYLCLICDSLPPLLGSALPNLGG